MIDDGPLGVGLMAVGCGGREGVREGVEREMVVELIGRK